MLWAADEALCAVILDEQALTPQRVELALRLAKVQRVPLEECLAASGSLPADRLGALVKRRDGLARKCPCGATAYSPKCDACGTQLGGPAGLPPRPLPPEPAAAPPAEAAPAKAAKSASGATARPDPAAKAATGATARPDPAAKAATGATARPDPAGKSATGAIPRPTPDSAPAPAPALAQDPDAPAEPVPDAPARPAARARLLDDPRARLALVVGGTLLLGLVAMLAAAPSGPPDFVRYLETGKRGRYAARLHRLSHYVADGAVVELGPADGPRGAPPPPGEAARNLVIVPWRLFAAGDGEAAEKALRQVARDREALGQARPTPDELARLCLARFGCRYEWLPAMHKPLMPGPGPDPTPRPVVVEALPAPADWFPTVTALEEPPAP